MNALSAAVVSLLSEYAEGDASPIADLKDRIFIGLIPIGESLPACVVDAGQIMTLWQGLTGHRAGGCEHPD